MSLNNILHISQSDLFHQSRIYKIVNTQAKNEKINKIFVVGIKKNKKSKITEKFSKKVELIRLDLVFRKISKNYLTYSLILFEYLFRIIALVKKKKINIISIHNVFLIPLAIYFKYLHSCKIIYDTHELETEAISVKGVKKIIAKFFEKIFIKKFDHIFVTSNEISNWYKKKYKIENISTIFNCLSYKKFINSNYLRKKFKIKKNEKIFIYLGALSHGRGIDIILNTFSKLSNKKAKVIFIGYGKNKDKILDYASSNKNIFFHDAVRYKEIINISSSADFGLSLIENTCLNEQLMLPNKIFEYAASGVTTITSNLLQSAKFVKNNNLGHVINLNEKNLKKIINLILYKNISKKKKQLLKFSKRYSWIFHEDEINKVYNSIINI